MGNGDGRRPISVDLADQIVDNACHDRIEACGRLVGKKR
jgi:hypothetical protein